MPLYMYVVRMCASKVNLDWDAGQLLVRTDFAPRRSVVSKAKAKR